MGPYEIVSLLGAGGMGEVYRARDAKLNRDVAIKILHTQGFVNNQPHNVEVAANGQKFLVNAIVGDSDNAPLEVTLNWTAGLKR